ncbi:metallophosphoesterase [Nocardioides zeae]|uniref:Metallophosphoesterase n=1 Tax=Nocardioides imazamoxiresistens TaxID=3231893 RepID=A0ABU3PY61_9ACTN|nr:metallophosphoesterase [Nocardioides zeae]MDT9594173.1 metallophosphoesterase [Nocardioides zeae]
MSTPPPDQQPDPQPEPTPQPDPARERRLRTVGRHAGRLVTGLVLLAVWAVVAVTVSLLLFVNSSRESVVAGHDAVVRPTLDGFAVVRPGAVLPDLRMDLDSPVGVEVALGKTEATSTEELVQRYAFIASQPDAQIDKVSDLVVDMALAAALRGAVAGLVPVGLWLLVGQGRRRYLLRRGVSWQGAATVAALVAAGVLIVQPWQGDPLTTTQAQDDADDWQSLDSFLEGAVTLPAEVAGIEVRSDVTTVQSRRLVESAISTYEQSQTFYSEAAEEAADLELRQPEEDETVVVLVSDRHDNIGMDPVARAIGDAGGATAVYNAGDDTSSGQPWEAFSLDSVNDAFSDLDRYSVVGNHDHGSFVGDYLGDLGWTRLAEGDIVEGPGGSVLMGVDDPRSSGLGNWRDEPGLSFDEVRDRITEASCEADERIATLLVHDAALGRDALAEGCVDLVIGGHIHVRSGPTAVEGENGEVGYTYTSGTTGGAAYAIAVGSKPRRPAETTLITYRDGRPVGMQWVVLQTNGRFDVGEYQPLDYATTDPEADPTAPADPDDPTIPGGSDAPEAPEDTAGPEDDQG